MKKEDNHRINVWSSPRNISTAFMYAWAQRPDTTVVDEPLYAHYLDKTGVQHPGQSEILASQNKDGNQVVQKIILGEYSTKVALFKQMTHHLHQLDESFLGMTDHVLLIRDPRRIIASYSKVREHPDMRDVGVKQQWELFQKLERMGKLAAVVDARLLLSNPKEMLQKLCDTLRLEFDERMLSWSAGARPEDGVWAKHWYENVHNSTGFRPYVEKQVTVRPDLEPLAAECMEYYQKLLDFALR